MIRPWSDSCTSAIRSSSRASSTVSPVARNSSQLVADGRGAAEEGVPAAVEGGDVGGEVAPEQAGLGEQHRDVGVTQDELELGHRGEGGDGHRDRAGHRRAEQRGHRLGAVAHQDADAGAFAEPGRDQGLGDPPRLGAQVGVGPADGRTAEQRVVEHERLVAREPGAHLFGEPADRQRAEAGCFREGWPGQRAHRCDATARQAVAAPRRDGRFCGVMPNPPVFIPRTIAEVFDHVLTTDPDRELLVTRSGRFSYADVDRLANRAAHALASLGVRAGDRVGGSLPNEVDVVIAFHGAMRLGAVWVGLNRALAPPEKEYLLTDSTTSLVLCDAPSAAQLSEVDVGGVAGRRRRSRRRRGRRAGVEGRDGGGRRLAARRRHRPARAGGHRVHERHDRLPQGCGAQPVQPADAGRGARGQPRLRHQLPAWRLPAAHDPQHAGAHHVDDGPGRRVLGDHGPHRRPRRRRVDPRRTRDRVERAARGDPLDGRAWTRSRRATSRRSPKCGSAAPTVPSPSAARSRRSSGCRCSRRTG